MNYRVLSNSERDALINRDICVSGAASMHAEWTTWPKWFYDMTVAGLMFHLDDNPHDIIDSQTGERIFSFGEANKVKARVDHIFEHCTDPWEFFPMPDDVANFQDAHERMTMEMFCASMGYCHPEEVTGDAASTDTHVHYYGGGYITEDANAGKFRLVLERSEWEADSLEELEGYLFNWWHGETGGFVYSKAAMAKAAANPRAYDREKLITLLKGHDEADGESYDELTHEEVTGYILEAVNGT